MDIELIWAQDQNGGIGKDGKLPWHISEDLQNFKKIRSKIKVTMVHGQKDEVVPVYYSKKILNIFTNAKKKLVIVKNGDHSLSSNKGLKILKKEIKLITS